MEAPRGLWNDTLLGFVLHATVSEINVQLKGQITQFCQLVLYGVIIMHITRPHVVTNPYDVLSSVEHKKRCETRTVSVTVYLPCRQKYAMQVNGD